MNTCEGVTLTPSRLLNSQALLDSRKPPPVDVKEITIDISFIIPQKMNYLGKKHLLVVSRKRHLNMHISYLSNVLKEKQQLFI